MSDIRTDDEQVELLKKWWRESGRGIFTAAVLVLAVWFGWTNWKDAQAEKAEAASLVFSQLVDAAAQPATAQTEELKARMHTLATSLKDNYGSTTYAEFASLFLARFAADAGDFDAAVTELQGLVDRASKGPVKYTAQVRLAQLLIQQEKFDEALALVNNVPDAAYTVQYEETRGDALFRKGELAEARAAYVRAQAAAQNIGLNSLPLQRKVEALADAEEA